ncbi:MAG: SET domain-containing protein-lysine N-methyltransferase [Nitrospirales bacterium]|nr:MAG: SET domain-containing protein-lysine N-methyltransferase [Nitrospirales bacterium]
MLHRDTELRKIDDEIGYGVFATQPIPLGTITWALDPLDQILDLHAAEQLENQYDGILTRYTWVNGNGHRILCWDFGRFMNHSCEANSYGPGGYLFEIAVRDIAAGEELTCDYATLNLEQPLICQCGSSQCRGVVKSDDLENIATTCDVLIRTAFTRIREVKQPLWHWVETQKNEIDHMVHHPDSIPSIVKHRWLPAQPTIPSKSMSS